MGSHVADIPSYFGSSISSRYRTLAMGSPHVFGKRVRILLADDHELIRRGLRELLEAHPGYEVCGEAFDGRDAVEKVKQLRPDIVSLDVSMPVLNGLEATRQILKIAPNTEILVLTVHESEQIVRDVLDAGARGYLLKSDAGRDFVAAIESLKQHRPFFTGKVGTMVLEGFLSAAREPAAGAGPLSSREREIVQLLAEGKSNKEVATILGISVKTAETHRNRIMHKLKLSSISELVHYAVRNGIIEP
jgi:DNA-binding NarL/FixJ family response regulator